MCAISIFIYYDWETDHQRNPTFSVFCFSAPVYSRYIHKYFWELLGYINRSACMLWMFLLIILLTLIHQYGKFPWPSLNRKHYGVLWLHYAHYIFTLHFVTSCYTMLHTFYTWYIMNILNQATRYIGAIINDYKQRETLLSVGAHFSIHEWVEFLRRHLLDHLRVKHHHTWALAHIEPGKVSLGTHKRWMLPVQLQTAVSALFACPELKSSSCGFAYNRCCKIFRKICWRYLQPKLAIYIDR